MKSIKYIITCSVVAFSLLFPSASTACIEISSEGYQSSPFLMGPSIDEIDFDRPSAFEETLDFWSGYTGSRVSRAEISKFFENVTIDSLPASGYSFYRYLQSRADRQALDYISLCLQLNKIQDTYSSNLWSYDKPSTDGFKKLLDKVNTYSPSSKFKPRYEFLKMRIYTALSDNAGVMKVWNNSGKSMSPSALRDRMEGYVGGVLYQQKKYPEALDYFCRLGDVNSIQFCIDKLVGAENLRKLYEHNPNSLATKYILKDYINYLIAATDAGRKRQARNDEDYNYYCPEIRELIGKKVYDVEAERKGMINLCDLALREGKTSDPMLWATAKGVMQVIGGESETGLATLDSAARLAGNDESRANLRRFTLWALMMNSGKGNSNIDHRFAKALDELYKSAEKQARDIQSDYSPEGKERRECYHRFYAPDFSFLCNFFGEEAEAYFFGLNQPQRAMACMAMLDCLPRISYDKDYLVCLRNALDRKRTLADARTFLAFADGSATSSNPIDACLLPFATRYVNLANDAIGTRLMRDGNFAEALAHLRLVDPRWQQTQAISQYLGISSFNPEYYSFGRSHNRYLWSPFLTNFKAEYCSEMIEAQKEYAKLTGDEKARKAIEIAAMYHFASPLGDGWAISDYEWHFYQPENEMSPYIRIWLDKALALAALPSTRAIANYALLTLPTSVGDYDIKWAIGVECDRQDKLHYYLDEPTRQQKEALKYISENWDTKNLPGYITGCDVLQAYVAGGFVSKPRYN